MFADGRIFPLSTAGMACGCAEWPIDGRDGQLGKEGWFGWEGQPPGPSMIMTHLTRGGGGGKHALGGRPPAWRQPKGGTHGARWTPNVQGFPALGRLTPDEEKRRDRAVPECSDVVVARDTTMVPPLPSELGRGCMAPLGRNVGVLQRGMRPAEVIGQAQQVAPVGVRNVKRKSAVRPLSAEVVEFSPTIGHKIDVITGQETVSSSGGGVAPVVVANVPVLMGAGVRFSAVAEVHASAVELDDDVLVVQASEQRAVCSTDPGRAPRVGSVPTAGAFGSKPLE